MQATMAETFSSDRGDGSPRIIHSDIVYKDSRAICGPEVPHSLARRLSAVLFFVGHSPAGMPDPGHTTGSIGRHEPAGDQIGPLSFLLEQPR